MSIFGQIKDKIAQYVDVRVKLVKLTVIGRTASLLSYFMYALLGIFVVFCILLFSGLSVVEGLMALGLSRLVSTVIMLGIYVLVMLLLVALRKSIIRAFSSIVIRILTEGDNHDDDDDDDDDKERK
jgi:uncharacterized membrane protein (DUF485 family)